MHAISLDEVTNPYPPPAAQWTPPALSTRPSRNGGLVVALGVVALIAVAALVVGIIGLTRSSTNDAGKAPTATNPSPTFTPEQVASAKKELCSTYRVAARSVEADTNSPDKALARISLANAAGMIDAAANDPALNSSDREAARALASAYWVTNAVSSVTDAASPLYQSTLDDAKRAADAMATVCR
jgi:cell division protein FtsN